MRAIQWSVFVLAAHVQAQSTVTVCESFSTTATSTYTEYSTVYVIDDRDGTRSAIVAESGTSVRSTSNTVSAGGVGNSQTISRSTTSITMTDNVPGNGTSLIIPDNTIAPISSLPTSSATDASTTSESSSSSGIAVNSSSTSAISSSASLSTSTSSSSSSTVSSTVASSSTTSASSSSNSTTTISTSPSSTFPTTTTRSTTSVSSFASSSTTTSDVPVVTNQAYIDTVLRHHAQHRLNHTSGSLTWNASLAETARKIADSCIYKHDTSIDSPEGSTYGQNIAAGYLPTQMSYLISDGFYNSEVNSYTYYGAEPNISTFHEWGHFSQIVWKIDTSSVGCYTMDCMDRVGQLQFPNGGGQNIRPFFTVCNYGGPGNWIGEFTQNVFKPLGLPSIHAGYLCPTLENCANNDTVESG